MAQVELALEHLQQEEDKGAKIYYGIKLLC
jgi:hypothetical protein